LVVLIDRRPPNLAVPFYFQVFVVSLGLIGWTEAASPTSSPQSEAGRVPTIEGRPAFQTPGAIVSTVRGGDVEYVPVSINGSPVTWWLVDTGATICEFDLDAASRLHLKRSTRYRLTTKPKNRGEHLVFVEAPDFLIGTVRCGPLVILAHPLAQALSVSRNPVNQAGAFEKTGLLGLNLLVANRALIRWRKQEICFNPRPDQIRSKADYEAEGYIAVPLTITASRQVELDGTLGSNRYEFCLDTGTPKTTIEQSIVDQDRLPSKLTNSVVRSPMNEFPDSKIRQVIGTQFKLGDYDLRNRKIFAASLHLTKSDRGDIWAGLIGADILWDYDAVIDFGSDRLYLREQRGDRPAG